HQVRDSIHLDLDRNGDLLLDLLRRPPGPLRDHLHPGVGHIRISLDRQLLEGDDSPNKEQDGEAQHDEAVVQREGHEPTNHYCCTVFWNSRALTTTCWPTLSPDSTSCWLPGSICPPLTSMRRNFLPSART